MAPLKNARSIVLSVLLAFVPAANVSRTAEFATLGQCLPNSLVLSASIPDPPSTRQTARESEVVTTTGKINDVLLALDDQNIPRASLIQQLVDQMISLAAKGHQPPRPIVTAFADELTGALKGQKLDTSHIAAVQRSIVEMMQQAGSSNLEPACHLRDALTAIGIQGSKISLIVQQFIAVGEAVRGADDSPL